MTNTDWDTYDEVMAIHGIKPADRAIARAIYEVAVELAGYEEALHVYETVAKERGLTEAYVHRRFHKVIDRLFERGEIDMADIFLTAIGEGGSPTTAFYRRMTRDAGER